MERINIAADGKSRRSRATLFLIALAAGWGAAIAYGLFMLYAYESTPGAVGLTPARWPTESRITPLPDRGTLVMLVHPQCSCTRASLEELRAIMNHAREPLSAWVLFAKPTDMMDGWEQSATWTLAQRIPGVTVTIDPDGDEAARFGARTSGHVALYDRRGILIFAGGITAARGHIGDNLGRQRILAQLDGDPRVGGDHGHAVYGCPLQ